MDLCVVAFAGFHVKFTKVVFPQSSEDSFLVCRPEDHVMYGVGVFRALGLYRKYKTPRLKAACCCIRTRQSDLIW